MRDAGKKAPWENGGGTEAGKKVRRDVGQDALGDGQNGIKAEGEAD